MARQDIPAEVGPGVAAGIADLGTTAVVAVVGLQDSAQVRHVEQLNSVRS